MVSYSLKDDCKLRQPYLAMLQDRLRKQAADTSPFSLLLSFPLLRDRKPREYVLLPGSARLGIRGASRQLGSFTADAAPSSFHSIHLKFSLRASQKASRNRESGSGFMLPLFDVDCTKAIREALTPP